MEKRKLLVEEVLGDFVTGTLMGTRDGPVIVDHKAFPPYTTWRKAREAWLNDEPMPEMEMGSWWR
jgi:hypothetical protein